MRVERCYNIAELRKLAKKNMPAPMFHYIDGAADDEWTLKRNTAAFETCEFMPRVLVDVSNDRHVDDAVRSAHRLAVLLLADRAPAFVPSRGRGRDGPSGARERDDLLAVEHLVDEHRGRGEAQPGPEGLSGLHVQRPEP